MSFREKYNEALAFKNRDVEEWIDMGFHRRIAALVTASVRPTRVTPNQLTLTSLCVGLSGSVFLYHAFFGGLRPLEELGRPTLFLCAGLALLAAVVFDCADGQLARVRGGGSLAGRILDGIIDALVLFPAYVILGVGIYREFGAAWFAVAVVAGFTSWARTIVYDKVKQVYLAHIDPSADGSSGIEPREKVRQHYERAREEGRPFDRFLLRVYLTYLGVQRRLASGEPDEDESRRLDDGQRRRYRDRHRGTMRLASFLGLGTHMVFIYGSIMAAAIEPKALIWAQAILVSVFNLALAVVLVRSRALVETN
ncbi:MAG: CDP-alcohol phosphatidyltransferase family protein [Persicimonas sp.]